MARQLTILLIEDHGVVREGLRHLLARLDPAPRVLEASRAVEGLRHLTAEAVDVVVLDLSLPDASGLQLIERIRARFPHTRTLVLSMHGEEPYALRAFRAGARGYVTKDSDPTELLTAVVRVAGGGSYVSPDLAEKVVQRLNDPVDADPLSRLSGREFEVLRRLARGQRVVDIARELHLSIKTVSTHKAHLLEKLDLHSNAELFRFALEHRLDDVPPALGPSREDMTRAA